MRQPSEILSIDLYTDGRVGVFDADGKPLSSYHRRRLSPRLVDRMMANAAPDIIIALVDFEGRMRTTPAMLRTFADLESDRFKLTGLYTPLPTTGSLTRSDPGFTGGLSGEEFRDAQRRG